MKYSIGALCLLAAAIHQDAAAFLVRPSNTNWRQMQLQMSDLTPEQQMAMMQQQMQAMMQQMQQMQMGIAPPVQQQPVAPEQQQPVAPVQQQPVAPVETVDPLSEAPGFEAPKPVEGVRADVMKYAPRAPEGRNRDAYEINNNADVYFAQLKRDSIVRNKARREGNLEAANSVFGEEGTQALAGYFSDEVVRTRRERNKDMYSTSRDEMVIPLEEDGETEAEKEQKMAYTGVSYRDALARKKASSASPTPVVSTTLPPVAKEPELVATEPEPVSETIPDPETPKLKAEADAIPMSASADDSEDVRRSLRTLQGLILKHRGGPGFGAGLLKGSEATRLGNSLTEVTNLLRKEAGMSGVYTLPQTSSPTTPTTDISSSTPLQGAIKCVEAAVNMYQLASTENEKDGLLVPLRDALLSAVSTINKAIDNVEQKQPEPEKKVAPPPTTMGFPETYAVTKIEDETPATTTLSVNGKTAVKDASANDPNTPKFQQAYDILKQSSGDAKFGLKELNKKEISKLKDALQEMRGILMEELDSGIPGTDGNSA